jgi:hypothetical protein
MTPLAMTNLQNGGRRSRANKSKRNRRRQKRGGTFVAGASVPAGLLLLNQYLKARKSRKASRKSSKKRRTSKRR